MRQVADGAGDGLEACHGGDAHMTGPHVGMGKRRLLAQIHGNAGSFELVAEDEAVVAQRVMRGLRSQ